LADCSDRTKVVSSLLAYTAIEGGRWKLGIVGDFPSGPTSPWS